MILGIDPGRTTALVVRHGHRLVDRALLEDLDLTGHAIEKAVDLVLGAALALVDDHGPDLIAVEAAVPPTPTTADASPSSTPPPSSGPPTSSAP